MNGRLTNRDALYIAAKAPRPGLAKTRLARSLGDRAALDLYRAFLRDLGGRFASFPCQYGGVLGWYITPPDAWPELRELVSPRDTSVAVCSLAQGEGDWTDRQDALFVKAAARGEDRTILVASDSPQLLPATIVGAFQQLDTHDLVLGPVADGGYYLIGMRGYHELLRGLTMSTRTVTAEIAARAAARGLTVGWAPPTFDIDELADLDQLRAIAARPDLAATRAALAALGSRERPRDEWAVPRDALAGAVQGDGAGK